VETGRCHRVALLWLGGGGKEFVAVSGMEEKRRSGDSLDAVASRSIVTYRMMKGWQATATSPAPYFDPSVFSDLFA
jgi:hypothetical protein